MDHATEAYRFIEKATSRHGKITFYFRRGKGPRIRLPDDRESKAFRAAYFSALNGEPIAHVRDMRRPETIDHIKAIEKAARIAVAKAKARANRKGMTFDLDSAWAIELVRKNCHRCPLSGIPFLHKIEAGSFMNPFTPSIDRVDNSLGYTKENCRVIIFALNAMISDWGEKIMHMVARGYGYQENKKRRSYPLTCDQQPLTSEN